MTIDWVVVATIGAPIITLFVGVWVNRRFENRPVLISYFGHVSSFRHTPPEGQPMVVHTHSVVLRNAGCVSATNVRLRHIVLPSFDIWPQLAQRIEELPCGAREIVIPTLVPGEQITISYLYFPPLTVQQINDGIRCDQGFAQAIPVFLQRQYPRWFNRTVVFFFFVGLVAAAYLAYQTAHWIVRTYT